MDLLLPTTAPYHSSYFSSDYTILHLDYYSIENNQYNEFFEQMNDSYHIYSQVQTLYICTDFINELPEVILNFQVLKNIIVEGSRWWNLNMTQIPTSIEMVAFTGQSNLTANSLKGCERLINLKTLKLDPCAFNIKIRELWESNNPIDLDISIPNLSNLIVIIFELPYGDVLDNPNWSIEISQHPVLVQVKHRIKTITYDHGDIQIILNAS